MTTSLLAPSVRGSVFIPTGEHGTGNRQLRRVGLLSLFDFQFECLVILCTGLRVTVRARKAGHMTNVYRAKEINRLPLQISTPRNLSPKSQHPIHGSGTSSIRVLLVPILLIGLSSRGQLGDRQTGQQRPL